MASSTESGRIRLVVAYRGGDFHGWQIQQGVDSVEGALTQAVARLAHRDVKVWGASRTDAGVHALGQVAAFDAVDGIPVETWYRALNKNTPPGLVVRRVDRVSADFHPRHAARGKVYRYQLSTGFHQLPSWQQDTWHVAQPLDVEAMSEAGRYLEGEHDFASFQGAGCDATSTVRRLFAIDVRSLADGRLQVEVSGSAFLKYMVRTIVGTLVEVGRGRRRPSWVADVLAARDRQRAGMTAPAHGLTLVRVFHPDWPVREPPAGEATCFR